MPTLKFNAAEVRRLVEHSKGKEHPAENYGQPLDMKEYLYLVHDQGVYLMSGAKEHLKLNDDQNFPSRSFVAYAEGCDPKDEDWYEVSRQMVGGDDFGEPLPLSCFDNALKLGAVKICLKMTKTSISVYGTGYAKR